MNTSKSRLLIALRAMRPPTLATTTFLSSIQPVGITLVADRADNLVLD